MGGGDREERGPFSFGVLPPASRGLKEIRNTFRGCNPKQSSKQDQQKTERRALPSSKGPQATTTYTTTANNRHQHNKPNRTIQHNGKPPAEVKRARVTVPSSVTSVAV